MSRPAENVIFEAAHAHVMKWEGGFFDHPADPGGVTNLGVSLMFLKGLGLLEGDINGDGEINRADVLACTSDDARTLFMRHFWDKPHAAELPPLVAVAFYDLAVNAGAGRSAVLLQQAINQVIPGAIRTLAYNVGPKTQGFSNQITGDGRQELLVEFMLNQRAEWYHRLVRAKPTSAAFLKGWIRRTDDCRSLVRRLAVQWGAR